MKVKKVERLMLLRLNANRDPVFREVREELARQQDERGTFRRGTGAVQVGLALEGKAIEIVDV